MTRRKTIGFLVDSIEESYQSAVFAGVVEVAMAADVSVLCFCGGVLGGSDAAMRNGLYDLVGRENTDGLVVMSGVLGNVVGHEAIADFCTALVDRGLPVVSLAVAMDGIPSIVVDNDAGMREAIDHLVRDHQRRDIAFIRGPTANDEAERRYKVYCDVLATHDLPRSDQRVVCGSFDRASGADAVRQLIDERGVAVDTIVAASDEMAIGAVQALIDRGIAVPDEIAVVGFDDIETARFCVPALTTVRQPLHEQGRRAAEMLLGAIVGETVAPRVELHTRLVTRQSCGCSSQEMPPSVVVASTTFEMATALGVRVDSRDGQACVKVLDAFETEPSEAAFMRTLEDALRGRLASGQPVGPWQDVISVLWRSRPRQKLELRDRARSLTSRYAELAQRDRLSKIERLTRVLTETSSALATSFDTASLSQNLARHLPHLGIRHACISTHRGGKLGCLFAMREGEVMSTSQASFPARELVPDGFAPDGRTTLVVQPLFLQEEKLGVALLGVGESAWSIYATLGNQISAAIKASALMHAALEHASERKKLLRYILDVTPDMQRVQPLTDLYPKILTHALGMLETSNHAAPGQSSAPPPPRKGLLAVVEGSSLVIRASSDQTAVGAPVENRLRDDEVTRMHEVIDGSAMQVGVNATLLPLQMNDVTLAVLRVEGSNLPMPDVELLSTFANQASAAIRAMQLYEMAALDPLTGTHTRRFFDDWLLREVRAAFRARVPVTVLMMDMDGLKQINDKIGHLAGDEALASIGKALREATRASDLVGRYGGDEFVVILPRTAERTAERVAQRIVTVLKDRRVRGPMGEVPLRLSIGASTLRTAAASLERLGKVPVDYFRATVQLLLKHADEALYRAKRNGGMQVCKGQPATWPTTVEFQT